MTTATLHDARPPAGRVGASPVIAEAPPHIKVLYAAWISAPMGGHGEAYHALETALWSYRNRWLVVSPTRVIWIVAGSRGDRIETTDRFCYLPTGELIEP